MPYSSTRLDRFLARHLQISRRAVREVLLANRVRLDGQLSQQADAIVGPFTRVELDGEVLQAREPLYLMLHKPVGVVCATKDEEHKTVLDLIRERPGILSEAQINELHIVGRLDLNTSGLVLLTNDGSWSRRLLSPEHKVAKVYDVTLEHPLDDHYIHAFAEGMHFPYEDCVTQPAKLEILSDCSPHRARVVLTEGKYHQIKRMFGRFRNPVLALHRCAIGEWQLDEQLLEGHWQSLSDL